MDKTILISLPIEYLQSLIVDCVNSCLKHNQFTPLKPADQPDKWFGLDDLIKYDPARRKKATWYSIVSRGEVPYHKNGKNLVFLKSEIDEWLKSGKRLSNSEIEAEAENYLLTPKGWHYE